MTGRTASKGNLDARRVTRTNFALFASLVAALLVVIPARPCLAQQLYGTIRGVVRDPSGAVVPAARVAVTNTATGVSRHATTQADGSFEFLNLLAPSNYTVGIEKNGFHRYASTQISLNVNQVYVVNATLQVGATTQQVTVKATPAQIDTTTMQLGTSVTGQQIVNLPLNGRNWTQLQQLEPGVVASSDRFDTYSTNGAETQQNAYLINGADSMDAPLNEPGIIPSPDALSEFRMVTSTLNPEFSRNSGAIMNVLIKNGTNHFHGDAFEFYRDTTLDARSFFQSSVSPFHENEFGGTLGGPIVKDHTFFFVSYQGFREAVPQAFSVPTVFSAAERSGNFSADTGGAFPLMNPATGVPAVSPFPMVGESGTSYPAGTPYATLFPTGVIPTTDLNPLAVKLMNQFVPLPNAAANTYTFNPTTTEIQDQGIWRVDEDIRPSDSVWAYGLWQRQPSSDTLPFTGATLPGFADTNLRHYQEYTGDWTHTFGPTTLNEARLSYFRFNFDAVVPQNPLNPSTYGFTGIAPQTLTGASLPVISLTGLFTLGFSTNGPQPRIDQTYDFGDNFSKIWGSHTFKAGFTMERFEVFNPFYNNLGGNFTFNGAGTFSTGFPGADFLLGLPDSYAQGSGSIVNARGREYYSYAQDQWQIRHNLTLTYGLGWDIETPWQNLYAGGETMAAFRQGESSTIFPPVPAGSENPTTGAPVGFLYPGDPGINKYGGPAVPYTDFAPRAGFAWSPGSSERWSVRGGFGIYYNRTEEELALQGLTNPPFSTTAIGAAAVGGSPSLAAPFSGWCPVPGASPVACSAAQVFPFTPPAKGAVVNFGPYEPIGFGMNVMSTHFGVPMSENYNLTIERQLTPSTLLSLGYVGNVGHHLEGAYVLNPAGTAPGVNPGAAALGCTAFNLASCDPGSFALNPLVYGSTGYQVTDFNSNYNSLQVELNKRFSNGLQLLASYTWSRYFDYTSNLENSAFNDPGINPFDFNSMYAPSANDAPQRLVLSYYYTLPIYRFVHRFRRLTDGWTLTGIATFQHGFPVAVFDSADTSLTCDPAISFYACPDRANVTGTPIGIGNPRTYTIGGNPNYWFNPKAFAIPAAGTGIGNASRNPLYGPGINNWDIALLKDIPITESKYIELRLETYNTFNQVQFAAPSGDVNSPDTLGRIFGVQTGSTNGDGRVLQLGGKFYF
jgi:hypothetical protein